ncbi:MAG: pyridoxal-dependent decarboxylase [Pseudomonadota bacterium]
MTDSKDHQPSIIDTLDPTDWGAFEQAVRHTLSASVRKMKSASDGPVWTPPTDDLKARLNQPLPIEGMDTQTVSEALIELLPYGVGNTHPRFFGWVHGSGTPGNLLADIAASAINANCGGRDHVGTYVERQVIDWCKSLFDFPETASGLIVSGTSMATIIAAKTARDAALNFDNRKAGLGTHALVGYTSAQAHSCLARAFDMTGLGSDALRAIPVNADHMLDVKALNDAIATDRAAGLVPFFLAGTAGTVNTGAIDDLAQLATIALDEKLWFHVDGAFGASGITSEAVAPRLRGIEQADSLAFDFHKWMHVNYDAGCVLIRDQDLHRRAFANRPDYLAANGRALAGGDPWPVDFGPELSRGFRALKVWAHFLEHGTQKIGDMITKNCEQASYLGTLVERNSNLELLAPVSLNICCFRFISDRMNEQQLDDLNAEIVAELQLRGIAAPSTTRLDGRLAIRVNLTNHRTQLTDIDMLHDAVNRLGRELSESG